VQTRAPAGNVQVEQRVGKRAAHAVKRGDGEIGDGGGMLCDVGLGRVVLCCVTDEVWIVRQSSALERKRGFVLLCVRIFAVLGRVDVWS
jgi:hypothetical protein